MKDQSKITIRPVDHSNWKDVINLKVKKNQEKYIALNVTSIAHSKIYEDHFNLAINCQEQVIGYILYFHTLDRINLIPDHLKQDDGSYTEIVRFMIDEKYQRKGIGSKALKLLLGYLHHNHGSTTIWTSYIKENIISGNIFKKAGFHEAGIEEKEEFVLRYDY
ncbi:hypothetical protein LCGC14_1162910 [marine sediment metagenome]|uniref:N-acetyltransferase domain-containing protein n=1 Tax=marine sediment metagenome TaxID=412755 RepID=A0A0F9LX58_9ZZZZ|nr:MAG: Spermine/spermidine acetyltransferase [Candidatus Lokiarchaeum sp. GC14_75]